MMESYQVNLFPHHLLSPKNNLIYLLSYIEGFENSDCEN